MDEPLGEPHDQYAQPVDGTLEQDGLDHWRAVEAAHEGQVVRYQDRFSDQQRSYRRSEEATELHAMLFQNQALGPQDQVEANEEEECWRQRMLHLFEPPIEGRRRNGAGAGGAKAGWLIRYPQG